jgi:acetyl-CoA acetyltransferase
MNDAFTCDAIRTPIGRCSPINRLRRSGVDAVDAAAQVIRCGDAQPLIAGGVMFDPLDVIELNEAFAAQALGVMRQPGIPDDGACVNPNGGAISLGHPLEMLLEAT